LGRGYKCCFSFDKNSKCRGEEGKIETIKGRLSLKVKEEELKKKILEENSEFKGQVIT
jgi:hypothetical protein